MGLVDCHGECGVDRELLTDKEGRDPLLDLRDFRDELYLSMMLATHNLALYHVFGDTVTRSLAHRRFVQMMLSLSARCLHRLRFSVSRLERSNTLKKNEWILIPQYFDIVFGSTCDRHIFTG